MREGVFSSEHCCSKNLHRDKGNKYSSIGRVFPYVHEVIVKIKNINLPVMTSRHGIFRLSRLQDRSYQYLNLPHTIICQYWNDTNEKFDCAI